MLAKAATGVRNPRVSPSPSDSSLMRMTQVMALGCGLTTASKPLPTNFQRCLAAMSAAQLIPAWRLIHASRFLCRKLSSHHSPSPMRRTAAHWAPVSREVFTPARSSTARPGNSHPVAAADPGRRPGAAAGTPVSRGG